MLSQPRNLGTPPSEENSIIGYASTEFPTLKEVPHIPAILRPVVAQLAGIYKSIAMLNAFPISYFLPCVL